MPMGSHSCQYLDTGVIYLLYDLKKMQICRITKIKILVVTKGDIGGCEEEKRKANNCESKGIAKEEVNKETKKDDKKHNEVIELEETDLEEDILVKWQDYEIETLIAICGGR